MTKVHSLKIDNEMFQAVVDGSKTAEYRYNDRNFQVGEYLMLCDLNSPNLITVEITHIVKGPNFGMPEGFALLSFSRSGVQLDKALEAAFADKLKQFVGRTVTDELREQILDSVLDAASISVLSYQEVLDFAFRILREKLTDV